MKVIIWFVVFLSSFLCDAQQPYLTLTVAQDGTGDFNSIQNAITSIRDLGPAEVVIKIKPGTYNEKIVIPSWKQKVTLQGENAATTIISNNDYSGKIKSVNQEKINTFTSYTMLIAGDDVKLNNLTIINTSCNEGQAVALHVEGDRFIAVNCNITGCQDALYAATGHSRQFYKDCYIQGTTDFIFGEATAVFTGCTIKNLSNSYITAAATTSNQRYGFVFFNCHIVAKDEVIKCYLGRPWRPYAQTVFINCILGKHIVPEGWNPWQGDKMFPDKESTCFYAEYNNSGEGSNTKNRVSWSHQLSKNEFNKYTFDKILSGSDHWKPYKIL